MSAMTEQPALAAATEDDAAYRDRARAWLAAHAGSFSGPARQGLTAAEDLALGEAEVRARLRHHHPAARLRRRRGH